MILSTVRTSSVRDANLPLDPRLHIRLFLAGGPNSPNDPLLQTDAKTAAPNQETTCTAKLGARSPVSSSRRR